MMLLIDFCYRHVHTYFIFQKMTVHRAVIATISTGILCSVQCILQYFVSRHYTTDIFSTINTKIVSTLLTIIYTYVHIQI